MERMVSEINQVYLVGIGGIGMSGLAFLLKDKGFKVSGSDEKDNQNVQMLKNNGIKVFIGHRRKQIPVGTQIVGYSSAIRKDNPEILEAKKRGIYILQRGKLLAEICQDKKIIAVAGSHGKTTTTSLLGYLLTSLGYNPTVFLGGLPLNYSQGAWWGGEYCIMETDESDGSFLYYDPWVSVITNVDSEHLDYFKRIDNLKKSFMTFSHKTKEKVIAWGDDPFLEKIVRKYNGINFGWKRNNLIQGRNFNFYNRYSCFDLYIKEKFEMNVKIPLIGEHNCLNVLAALSFFYYLGEDLKKVSSVLQKFKGTRRRFQIKAKARGVIFIDDYAHHPTEIKAVLKAARLLKPRRLLVIFQPHRFSRMSLLYKEFLNCFSEADDVFITDVYSASEKNDSGVRIDEFCKAVAKKDVGKCQYVSRRKLLQATSFCFHKGDLVLILGAGDINLLMDKVVKEFEKNDN